LENDLRIADKLANCICSAAAIPMPPITVLRVAVSPLATVPLPGTVSNPSVREVLVSAFRVSNVEIPHARAVCLAVSKSIEMMREHVWCLRGKRVIILCVSKVDYIDIPVATSLKYEQLRRLETDLRAEQSINHLFTSEHQRGPIDDNHVIAMF
jgi:hypothetical protein